MKRLLLIEDEEPFVAYVKAVVAGDYIVTAVASRAEAELVARTERFAAVLLDLTLEDSTVMETMELAAKVAAHQPDAPLIVVTGDPVMAEVIQGGALTVPDAHIPVGSDKAVIAAVLSDFRAVVDGAVCKLDISKPDDLMHLLEKTVPTHTQRIERNGGIISILALLAGHTRAA